MDAKDFIILAHVVSRYYACLELELQDELDAMVRSDDRDARYAILDELLSHLVFTLDEISGTNRILLGLEITGKESLSELDREELEQATRDLRDHRILRRALNNIASVCAKRKIALPKTVKSKNMEGNKYIALILKKYYTLI